MCCSMLCTVSGIAKHCYTLQQQPLHARRTCTQLQFAMLLPAVPPHMEETVTSCDAQATALSSPFSGKAVIFLAICHPSALLAEEAWESAGEARPMLSLGKEGMRGASILGDPGPPGSALIFGEGG